MAAPEPPAVPFRRTLRIDRQRCVGAGQCVRTAPELFDQSEADGLVILLAPNPPEDALERARKAVRLCPARALSFEED